MKGDICKYRKRDEGVPECECKYGGVEEDGSVEWKHNSTIHKGCEGI